MINDWRPYQIWSVENKYKRNFLLCVIKCYNNGSAIMNEESFLLKLSLYLSREQCIEPFQRSDVYGYCPNSVYSW